MSIHPNTLECYEEMKPEFNPREIAILETLGLRAMSDRAVMQALGFHERNAVAPRITRLVKIGVLVEVGAERCPVTDKHVRLVMRRAAQADAKTGQLPLL